MRNKGNANSAVIIARVLGIEGYSNHVHNEVKRWWNRRVLEKHRVKSVQRLEREFSEFMQDASERDRLLVGKFIGLRSAQSFDAGFRIGFQALLFEHGLDPSQGVKKP